MSLLDPPVRCAGWSLLPALLAFGAWAQSGGPPPSRPHRGPEAARPTAPAEPTAPVDPVGNVKVTPSTPAFRSSLFELVEAVALSLEARAEIEGVRGPIQLEAAVGRGLDARRADRVFTNRLRRRLRERGKLTPVSQAPVKARVVLSLEGSRLWAVGLLEGGVLPGPSSFAVSRAMDRELETLFGKAAGTGRTRWVLERLGPIPAGALDLALVDVDDDLVDDLVVLGVDGVRTFRYTPGDSRPEPLGELLPFPGSTRWPRVVMGWLAPAEEGKLWIATTAGHRYLLDAKAGKFTTPARQGVPLRQQRTGAADRGPSVVVVRGAYGTPTLAQPFTLDDDKEILNAPGLPRFLRDLRRWPGRDTWLWVDEAGRVGGWSEGGRPTVLAGVDRSGDRIVLDDLDGDGQAELATSAATPPGEADQLTLYRVDPELKRQTVAFRSTLSGGEIAALALGDLDLDERPDLVVIEEPGGEEAVVWRLEYAP